MRNMNKIITLPNFLKAFMLLGLIITIWGCAIYNVRQVKVIPMNDWEFHTTKSNIEVALNLNREFNKEDESYPLNRNGNKKSILPVHVMVINDGPAEVLVKKNSLILEDNETQYKQIEFDDMYSKLSFSPLGRYFIWAFGISLPVAFIGVNPTFAVIPGILVGFVEVYNAKQSNERIREDIYSKSLRNSILHQGDSVNGFIFFDVPMDKQSNNFRVKLRLLYNDESEILFEF